MRLFRTMGPNTLNLNKNLLSKQLLENSPPPKFLSLHFALWDGQVHCRFPLINAMNEHNTSESFLFNQLITCKLYNIIVHNLNC